MKFTFAIIIFITLSLPAFSQFTSWEQVGSLKLSAGMGYWTVMPVKLEAADSMNFVILNRMPWFRSPTETNWLWQTTDGGDTWNIVLKDTTVYTELFGGKIVYDYFPARALSMAYPNTKLCIIGCDSGYYWRSTDNCKTWKRHRTSNSNNNIAKLKFYNENFGYSVFGHRIYSTSNGGLTWDLSLDLNLDSAKYDALYYFDFITIDTCYITCSNSDIEFFLIKTTDRGLTWNTTKCDEYGATSLCFLDGNRGFRAGTNKTNSSIVDDLIIYTADGGDTWVPVVDTTIQKWGGLSNLDFYNGSSGFAFSFPDRLWLTFDGGKTWNLDKNFNSKNIPAGVIRMEYLSSDTFIAHTWNDLIYRGKILPVSVQEQPKRPEELLLFPNPAKNVLNIRLPETLAPTELSIYNILGEKVLSAETQSPEAKLNISSLPAGVYTVRATINGTEYSEKFVKAE